MAKYRDVKWLAFFVLFGILMLGGFVSLYSILAIDRTESSMIQQYKVDMVNVINLFDKNFEGTFQDIIDYNNLEKASTTKRLQALNTEFKQLAVQFTEIYPGVDIGAYSSDIQSIVIGGRNYKYYPTGQLGEEEYYIKQTLGARTPLFFTTANQLRYYKPLIREGKVIGVLWGNRSLLEIYNRTNVTKRNVYIMFTLSLLLGLALAIGILFYYVRSINLMRNGLVNISTNLNVKLPTNNGELGEIASTINKLGQQLKESRTLTEAVLQSVQEGIAVIDESGKTILANAFARQILDSLQQESGGDIGNLLTKDRVFSTHKVSWSDGFEERVLLVGSVPMKDVTGERVVTFKDITLEEKAQQKIQAMERFVALGKMVAGVAHEIRNPLTSIAGYIQFWRKKGLAHLTEESLETISKEIKRLNAFVEKLLFFTKTSVSLDEDVDLQDIVQEVTAFVTMTYPQVVINLEKEPFLPPIKGDRSQLHSVLENVIFNGVQAMEEKGTINIVPHYQAADKKLCLKIHDTGKGIKSEHLKHVFDPFFTTKPKGTGLGLAISYEIIRLHQGEITVESSQDSGTTFTICLPCREEIKNV